MFKKCELRACLEVRCSGALLLSLLLIVGASMVILTDRSLEEVVMSSENSWDDRAEELKVQALG